MPLRNPRPPVGYENELPRRLRELRRELGMTLADVVPFVGVAQKGVISNWEALNQRQRTPEMPTLFALQRLYGVSLDYLVGNPKAERDSPDVKAGKRELHKRLSSMVLPRAITPSHRATLALQAAFEVAPDAFFPERAAVNLGVSVDQLCTILDQSAWPSTLVSRLACFLGVPEAWFYPPAAVNHAQS